MTREQAEVKQILANIKETKARTALLKIQARQLG